MITVKLPIPETIWRDGWQYLRAPLIDKLWKASLVVLGLFLLYMVLAAGPGTLILTLLGITLGVTLSGKVRQILVDIWRRDFAKW